MIFRQSSLIDTIKDFTRRKSRGKFYLVAVAEYHITRVEITWPPS